MSLLRSVGPSDALFLFSVGLLWASVLIHWTGRERIGRGLGTVGWSAFAAFWVTVAGGYLVDSRYFLGSIGAVTVGVSVYAATLAVRGEGSVVDASASSGMSRSEMGVRVTFAFAVMGALFAAFEYVDPVHSVVLGAVAAHTAFGLELAGFSPVVGVGQQGYANVVFFSGLSTSYAVSLVSACSGISAMALFAGLVAATDADLSRKVVVATTLVGLVYVLNVVRALFVSGALAGEWFAFAQGLVRPVFGVTDPRMASYYFAEYLIAQMLVIVVLFGVYVQLARRFPEAQTLVEGFLDSVRSDVDALADRIG